MRSPSEVTSVVAILGTRLTTKVTFLYGSALVLAVAIGAATAYTQSFLGDGGPYILVGALLALGVGLAVLWEWRLGVLMLPVTLPYEGTLNFGPLGNGIKVLALLTLFSLALGFLRERELSYKFIELWRQPLTLALFAFVLWCLASILWASNQEAALARTSTFLGVFALMVVVGMLERRYLVGLWVFTALSAVLSVPAAAYILPQSERMATTGRFSSGIHPNDYAGLLVIVFLAVHFGVLRGRFRIISYALAPILFFGIFASESRTGVLALVAAPLLALFIPSLTTRVALRALLMYGLAAAALAVTILAVPSIGESIVERYSTLSQYSSEDTWAGRWSIWQGALQVFASNPLLGVGAGNFPYVALNYSVEVAQHAAAKGLGAGVAHNIFLTVVSELGLIGLILFLGVLFYAFKLAWQLSRTSTLGTGMFLCLLAYVIIGMTTEWTYEKIGYVVLGTLLSLTLQKKAETRVDLKERIPLDKGAANTS